MLFFVVYVGHTHYFDTLRGESVGGGGGTGYCCVVHVAIIVLERTTYQLLYILIPSHTTRLVLDTDT